MPGDIKEDIKRFFKILDITEESDSGTVFHPIYFSCCRVMLGEELEAIFKRMKKYAQNE